MSTTPKSPIKQEKLAAAAGMDRVQWLVAKSQVAEAKNRGRRPEGKPALATKLAEWGDVEGQGDLFAGGDQL